MLESAKRKFMAVLADQVGVRDEKGPADYLALIGVLVMIVGVSAVFFHG